MNSIRITSTNKSKHRVTGVTVLPTKRSRLFRWVWGPESFKILEL